MANIRKLMAKGRSNWREYLGLQGEDKNPTKIALTTHSGKNKEGTGRKSHKNLDLPHQQKKPRSIDKGG
jgi:hypothetical protein